MPYKFKKLTILLVILWLMTVPGMALAEGGSVTANTDGIDEIVVVGSDGYVYAYNHLGEEVFKSPDAGWLLATTRDFNNDGDHEIVAVSGNRIKIYDPQVINNAPYNFDVTYSGTGTFTNVDTGFIINDNTKPDIALIRSRGGTVSRIILYEPGDTSTQLDAEFVITDWQDFAIGDYDGDGDEDYALIYWNDDYQSGYKNWVEIRKGHDPLQGKYDDVTFEDGAGDYSDNQWFDIVSGEFYTGNGTKREWVGSRNLADDDGNIVVQKWNEKIRSSWGLNDAYEFLAAGDFRGEGYDQIAMFRNIDERLRFAGGRDKGASQEGAVWNERTGQGSGWLAMAAGNVDSESTYDELVMVRNDRLRIYLKPQSSNAADIDCNIAGSCKEINGSFTESIAVGDLGVTFRQPDDYELSVDVMSMTTVQSDTISSRQFSIYGDVNADTPMTWGVTAIPYVAARTLQQALVSDDVLDFSITPADGITYQTRDGELQRSGAIPWMSFTPETGTTPNTVTVTFSDTMYGSPIHTPEVYRATILVYQYQTDDRYRDIDVTLLVGAGNIYLPLVLK